MIKIPKSPNEETRMVAARKTAKELINDAEVEGSIEEIAEDIAKYCRTGDGFSMAKDLERHGWDCDMRIAEVLNGHTYRVDKAHQEYLKAFQKEHSIEPPLPIGTKVKTRHGIGLIDSIYEHSPMQYAIKVDGDKQADAPTNRRILVYFDDAEAA